MISEEKLCKHVKINDEGVIFFKKNYLIGTTDGLYSSEFNA